MSWITSLMYSSKYSGYRCLSTFILPHMATILEQNNGWVKILEDHFIPPSPTMPAIPPLSKIVLFVKATLNTTPTKFFSWACISGFPILHKWLKSLTYIGVGIHRVSLPWNLSLSLSLFRTLGPGDGYGTNVSLSLHICFKKIVLDPKKYHMKTLLLIPFSMKLLLA